MPKQLKAFRIVTSMPAVLLKTATKHFQVARQRLSESFSDLIVSRVSSFDSYSNDGTPYVGENGAQDPIIEGNNELEDLSKRVKQQSQAKSNLLSDRRPKREKSVSYSKFLETLSPNRLSEFFRPKENASPVPTFPMLSSDSTEGSKTPSSIAFCFSQAGRMSSDSLMSDDRDEERQSETMLPKFPSLDPKASPASVALKPKPEEEFSEPQKLTSMKRNAESQCM